MPSLWTPDRDIPLDKDLPRGVQAIDSREMVVIKAMDTIAQRHHIVLACAHCRQPFHGLNDGHASVESISCGCRELRAVVRKRIVGG